LADPVLSVGKANGPAFDLWPRQQQQIWFQSAPGALRWNTDSTKLRLLNLARLLVSVLIDR
jgi:hypothetical protein